jgi:hypothetical protein
MLALSSALGVITWLPVDKSQVREAVHMTVIRYPALVIGSLCYGAIITVGIAVPRELARSLERYAYPSSATYTSGSILISAQRVYGDVLRQLAWKRGFDALIPDPGSPFAKFIPYLRLEVSKNQVALSEYERYQQFMGALTRQTTTVILFVRPSELGLIVAGSVIFIVLAESLLRFRTVMAFKPPDPQTSKVEQGERLRRFTALDPLIDSARFTIRNLGAIIVHVWFLRLALSALSVLFIELPLAAVDRFVVPNIVRYGAEVEIISMMDFAGASSAAIVNGILLAFSAVYDARLYTALATTHR